MYSLPIDAKGLAVTPDALADLTVQTSTPENGGTFPAGVNDLWHGGVHIAPVSGLPFHAAMPGTIVAARLGAEDLDRYGSPNFLLLRHTWPPFADGKGTPFYSAYVHLAPPSQTPASLKAIGSSADEAPWFTTMPQLRVMASTLNVRGARNTEANIETQVSRGTQLPILDGPTDRNGFRWWTVDAPGIPYESYAAERRLDGDGQYAERVAPAIDADTLSNLQAGDVVALDRPVAAGTQLWWSGEFGFPPSEIVSGIPLGELFKRAPTLHWEVFSGAPVLGHEDGTGDGREVGAWKALEDQNDDYVLNPDEAGSLHDTMEQIWSESDATETIEADSFGDASPDDRLPFFIEEERLRRTAAKFRSEWDIQNEAMAMEGLQWWGEAASAGVELPDSSKTWHYHPVGALEAIRPRFTVKRNGSTLDEPVETVEDVAERVIADLGYTGELSSLSESEFDRVQSEMHDMSINVAAPAPESEEHFANVEFKPHGTGYKYFHGTPHTFGVVESERGEDDPDFYTLLQNDARDGLPENQFDRNVWASLSDSEGSLRAVNTWDAAFLSAGPFQHTAGTNGGKGELPGVLDTVQEHAPEAYWRHFGRFGLQPVGTEISAGAKYGYFELRGTTLDTPEKKKKLRRFKWPHRFREALRDENISRWVLTEGFRRLDRIRDRTLTLEVKAPNREEPITFDARIGDLFRRDLMQALLLDWHINYPAEVWKQELGEWYIEEGEQKYDPGNQWRDHLQDHLQTWAGEWSQTLTEALPLEEDDDGNRMLNGPLDLSDAEAYELTASLLAARTEGVMTDPVGRAADILGYTNDPDVQNLVTENQPEGSQTGPDFLNRIMSLGENDRYTADGVWNTIQNQNRQLLSFDSPTGN